MPGMMLLHSARRHCNAKSIGDVFRCPRVPSFCMCRHALAKSKGVGWFRPLAAGELIVYLCKDADIY